MYTCISKKGENSKNNVIISKNLKIKLFVSDGQFLNIVSIKVCFKVKFDINKRGRFFKIKIKYSGTYTH